MALESHWLDSSRSLLKWNRKSTAQHVQLTQCLPVSLEIEMDGEEGSLVHLAARRSLYRHLGALASSACSMAPSTSTKLTTRTH